MSDRKIVPAIGPLDAEILLLGESPAREEERLGEPFVGQAGKMLNTGLRNTGIDRSRCRIVNCVPIRAPGDKFAEHSTADKEWGYELLKAELLKLENLKVIVALGANPFSWLMSQGHPPTNKKGEGYISEWRGSGVYAGEFYLKDHLAPEEYLWRTGLEPLREILPSVVIIPTYHPAAVSRSFDFHPWFLMDLQKARKIAKGYKPNRKHREWFVNQPGELSRLLNVEYVDELKEGEERNGPNVVRLVAIDTEINPPIISFTTEDEVHVFDWTIATADERNLAREILEHPWILKIAHNWNHDHAFIRKQMGIVVQRPYFDTYGGAQILNTALDKDLSPSIATRFTDWPYHKWMVDHDAFLYCGIDGIVAYDSYWPIVEELDKRGLMAVADHDHKLLTPLLDMQAVGFSIDETGRKGVEKELEKKVEEKIVQVQGLVEPVVQAKFSRFEKKHLFKVDRKCPCCGGGKKQRGHCKSCFYKDKVAPGKETKEDARQVGLKTIKELKEAYPGCVRCNGTGKIVVDLPFNPDSPDMVADVLYRGLGLRARRYKGKETVKAASLEGLKDKHVIVESIIEFSAVRAEKDTVDRLMPGFDNRLHCVFDPWGPGSGRVAGKEGLVEPGTNPMNLPLEARRFVVPDEGYTLLYPDYNAIEARAVALLSGDAKFLAAFKEPVNWPGNARHGKIDSHTKVMQFLLLDAGVEINRDAVKRLTYGSMYGGGVPQMTKEINAEMFRKGLEKRFIEEEIERAQQAFFSVFKGVKQWQLRICREVLETKRLKCPFTGREFTWTDRVVDTKTGELKNEIAKQAWSRLPQNIGGWVLANGLIDLYYNSGVYGTLIQPLVHVHDALLQQAPTDQLPLAIETAQHYLTRTEWGMYFPTEMKTGANWLEASGG